MFAVKTNCGETTIDSSKRRRTEQVNWTVSTQTPWREEAKGRIDPGVSQSGSCSRNVAPEGPQQSSINLSAFKSNSRTSIEGCCQSRRVHEDRSKLICCVSLSLSGLGWKLTGSPITGDDQLIGRIETNNDEPVKQQIPRKPKVMD